MAQQAAQIDFTQPPPAIDFTQPPPSIKPPSVYKDDAVKEVYGVPFVVPGAQFGGEMGSGANDPAAAAKIKLGSEMVGGAIGGEAAPAVRGLVGALARVLGVGVGAGAGNALGQAATTGKLDPEEAAKAAATWGGTQGVGEIFGAMLPALRSSLSRLMYTGEVAKDGTPILSKTAQSVLHPTEMPENILRAVVPPTPEVQAAQKAARAEQFETEFQKQYGDFQKAKEASAEKLEEMMKAEESARQKQITDWAKLQTQQGSESAAAIRRQALLDAQTAKNAPPVSPFAGATSSASFPGGVPSASMPLANVPGTLSSTASGVIPQGSATPFVSKFTPPEAPRIVTPSSAPPPINRTLVSYDAKTLVQMARSGDLDALNELIRNPRGVDINKAVPNAKYLLEANRATNIYGGPKRGTLSELTK